MVQGRIKAGDGALIGNAGEYYVMAELLKRGAVAALAARNAPAFDILATKGRKTVKIRVKTKSEQYEDWQFNAKRDNSIFRDLDDDGDFTVLVDLSMETINLKFYVIPTKKINSWLLEDFKIWLRTPGMNGRPHNPENRKRHLSQKKSASDLGEYLNNWDALWI